MILITKGGLSRGGDNEMPENCLYDCRLRDTCIYVPRWADEETLLRIGTERSKSCPLVQVYEVPKETEQAHTVMFERKTEPTISKMEQVDEPKTQMKTQNSNLTFEKADEPQTMYYPQVDGITPSVIVKDEPQIQLTAKCLECNNSKACKENHWDGCQYEPLGYEVTAVVGTIKDESQTDCDGCQHYADEYTADACYECSRSYADCYEPQTYKINPKEPTNDDKCFECYDFFTCGGQCNKIEDEPQAERSE